MARRSLSHIGAHEWRHGIGDIAVFSDWLVPCQPSWPIPQWEPSPDAASGTNASPRTHRPSPGRWPSWRDAAGQRTRRGSLAVGRKRAFSSSESAVVCSSGGGDRVRARRRPANSSALDADAVPVGYERHPAARTARSLIYGFEHNRRIKETRFVTALRWCGRTQASVKGQ
jgi:hypothetical protein